MGIEKNIENRKKRGMEKLLVSKSEKIIESLPTDEKGSRRINKIYQTKVKILNEKRRYFFPTYHGKKPEPAYVC